MKKDIKQNILFLQLLALKKLNKLPEGIPSIFTIYKILTGLTETNQAFAVDERTLESLSKDELNSMILRVNETNDIELTSLQSILKSRHSPRDVGEFFLPLDLADTIVKIAQIKTDETVICPQESLLWLAFKASEKSANISLFQRDFDPIPSLFNILLEKQVKPEQQFNNQFDVCLSSPLLATNSEITGQLKDSIELTKARTLVILPSSFLFRTSASDRQFKENLLTKGLIKSVIALPKGVLPTSATSVCMVEIDKKQTHKEIFFYDASHETANETIAEIAINLRATENSGFASIEQCAANGYNLLPARYVTPLPSNQIQTYPLDNLVDIIRTQSARPYYDKDGEEYFEISAGDIAENGYVSKAPKDIVKISQAFKERYDKLILRSNDLIFPIKGAIGRAGLIPENLGSVKWIANPSIVIMRLKPHSPINDIRFLYNYFTSDHGQKQIAGYTCGTGIQFIQMPDLRNLQIPILPKNTQVIIDTYEKIQQKFKEIETLRTDIKNLQTKINQTFKQKPT